MEKKHEQNCCTLLTRLIVKPRYLSGHRASASKTRFDVPPPCLVFEKGMKPSAFFSTFGQVKLTSNTEMSNSRALSG